MSIKRRIWALPVLASIIFAVGLAVTVYFSTSAISSIKATEEIDYPVLDSVKLISASVQGLADELKDAVSEGDKKRIDAVAVSAQKIRDKLAKLADLPGQRGLADRIGQATCFWILTKMGTVIA